MKSGGSGEEGGRRQRKSPRYTTLSHFEAIASAWALTRAKSPAAAKVGSIEGLRNAVAAFILVPTRASSISRRQLERECEIGFMFANLDSELGPPGESISERMMIHQQLRALQRKRKKTRNFAKNDAKLRALVLLKAAVDYLDRADWRGLIPM